MKVLAVLFAAMVAAGAAFFSYPMPPAAPDLVVVPGIPPHEVIGYIPPTTGIENRRNGERCAAPVEVGVSPRLIGRVVEETTVRAEIWDAGAPGPVLAVARLAPGTWLIPAGLYASPELGKEHNGQ